MLIRTQRLCIREYSPADLSDLHEIFSDLEVMRHCEPVYDEEKTRQTLAYFLDSKIAYAVTLAQSEKVIGHLLFHQLPMEEAGIYEIGWFFNRAYWHQGYAYEACSAMIDYGFRELQLHKLCAETIDPVRSVALMKKLGMSHEGTFRSHTRAPDGRWADVYWYAICNPMEES
ncbi:MAG: GNAT family N-acetyltransferase [Oscillospiraceae bacterium]|nr:GNAT family N-acetyltransferase [Oscillospiraceae bacterium]